jgi:hypothetical protein
VAHRESKTMSPAGEACSKSSCIYNLQYMRNMLIVKTIMCKNIHVNKLVSS